jgi:hypothetical protein
LTFINTPFAMKIKSYLRTVLCFSIVIAITSCSCHFFLCVVIPSSCARPIV